MRRIYKELAARICVADETQQSIAEKIGISASAMSAKMQGKSSFTLDEVAAIGKRLKIDELDYYRIFVLPTAERK